ncbi:MAG: hypothetical protein WBL68_05030, partial [Nitrososphaeraceae archaeon]
HIFRPVCDATDCGEDAKYERKITVSAVDKPFMFTAFFCENHKDKARYLCSNGHITQVIEGKYVTS